MGGCATCCARFCQWRGWVCCGVGRPVAWRPRPHSGACKMGAWRGVSCGRGPCPDQIVGEMDGPSDDNDDDHRWRSTLEPLLRERTSPRTKGVTVLRKEGIALVVLVAKHYRAEETDPRIGKGRIWRHDGRWIGPGEPRVVGLVGIALPACIKPGHAADCGCHDDALRVVLMVGHDVPTCPGAHGESHVVRDTLR